MPIFTHSLVDYKILCTAGRTNSKLICTFQRTWIIICWFLFQLNSKSRRAFKWIFLWIAFKSTYNLFFYLATWSIYVTFSIPICKSFKTSTCDCLMGEIRKFWRNWRVVNKWFLLLLFELFKLCVNWLY